MNQPIDKAELIAYADGELPPRRAARIERALDLNPGLRREVEQLRRLRATSRAVLRDAAPPVSEDLRRLIEAIAVSAQSKEAFPAVERTSRMRTRVLALAASIAVVLGGAAATWLILGRDTHDSGKGAEKKLATTHNQTEPVPATVTSAVQRKHLSCSQMEDHFFDPRFPREIGEIESPMRDFLGHAEPIPDLSSIGYTFAGAGPCAIPGGKTLHLLYRMEGSNGRTHVSLFIQPFIGQVHFDTTRVVALAGPDAAHPIVAWRSNHLVYFLIGDDVGATRAAARKMDRTWVN